MCSTPFLVKDQNKEYIPVPCGKCPPCLKRRASAWSFRLRMEDRRSSSSLFITLTYSTKHVPILSSGYMTLEKRALQLFFKRLRKKNPGQTLKYYACGEYGEKDARPHYHIILFNADISTIQDAWPFGYVHYGTVTAASVGYCLKYMQKPSRIAQHKNDDRQKEFQLQSIRLGDNYITDAARKWHTSNLLENVYLPLEAGKKASMPRYYKDRIYSIAERSRIAQWGYHRAIQESIKTEENIRRIYKRTPIEVEKVKVDQHRAEFQKMYREATSRNNIIRKSI